MDKWFNNNNVIRVVAVVLGILLWVIVRLDVQNSTTGASPSLTSEKITNASITVVGLDENRYSIISIDPKTVNVEINGSASAMRKVSTRDYKIELDLSSVEPGEQLVPVRATGFPKGVEVNIDPPNVYVTVEEKQRKEIPVAINVTGTPAEGYTAGEPIVEPNRVNVTVSGTMAEKLDKVVGEISVDGATSTVKQQVKLAALDKKGDPLDVVISPPVVDVEVPVSSPFKTVPLQIKLNGDPPAGYAVGAFEQNVSEVTVYGKQAYLNSLEFYDGLSIDLSGLTQTTNYEFTIPMHEGIELVSPTAVTARVTIVPSTTATLNDIPLSVNGKSEEYSYKLVTPADPTFNVTIEAAPDIAATLTKDDVKAIVNVSNMPAGVHQLPVEYNLPSFVKAASGNVQHVTLEITSKAGAGAGGEGGGQTGANSSPGQGDSGGSGGVPPNDSAGGTASGDLPSSGQAGTGGSEGSGGSSGSSGSGTTGSGGSAGSGAGSSGSSEEVPPPPDGL
ncbi:CdaR family protein [Paenibacillus thermotolerans]|uniref:CdaR family protein n=1 Tax=Paenibacillus thermotolerans TaxID=3027807 RepID=UPI002367F88A|nr:MULTISPECIES: CdaR family protein [unclassified Paenibacillus]